MRKPKCRLCGHEHNSWDPHVFSAEEAKELAKRLVGVTADPGDVERVFKKTIKAVQRDRETDPIENAVMEIYPARPGETCSHCGQKVPLTPALKQKAYRERKKK